MGKAYKRRTSDSRVTSTEGYGSGAVGGKTGKTGAESEAASFGLQEKSQHI